MQGHGGVDGSDADRINAVVRADADLSLYNFFNFVEILPLYSFLKTGGCQARMYHCRKNEKLERPEIEDIKKIADEKNKIVSVFRLEEII